LRKDDLVGAGLLQRVTGGWIRGSRDDASLLEVLAQVLDTLLVGVDVAGQHQHGVGPFELIVEGVEVPQVADRSVQVAVAEVLHAALRGIDDEDLLATRLERAGGFESDGTASKDDVHREGSWSAGRDPAPLRR